MNVWENWKHSSSVISLFSVSQLFSVQQLMNIIFSLTSPAMSERSRNWRCCLNGVRPSLTDRIKPAVLLWMSDVLSNCSVFVFCSRCCSSCVQETSSSSACFTFFITSRNLQVRSCFSSHDQLLMCFTYWSYCCCLTSRTL